MQSPPPRGVFAAVPTPITPDGEPDTGRFLRHARWALANGCDGLNVLGTTGEANSLSAAQRKAVMTAAASELERSRLMMGTGTPDLATTIDLTRFAHEKGFAAALVLPPYYYKGVTDEGLFAWFDTLVQATRDAPIPLYFYNFPRMAGVAFSVDLLRRMAGAFPGRVAGVKDSSGDLAYAAEIAAIEGLDVYPGNEVLLGDLPDTSFAGCISATVNATAPLVAGLWADRRDAARLEEVRAAREAMAALPLVAAVKYMVGRIHDDPAFEQVLPPHEPLTPAEKASLTDVLPAAA